MEIFRKLKKRTAQKHSGRKKKEITQEGIICFLLSPLLPLQRSLQAQDSQNSCPKIARPFLPAREGPLEDANATRSCVSYAGKTSLLFNPINIACFTRVQLLDFASLCALLGSFSMEIKWECFPCWRDSRIRHTFFMATLQLSWSWQKHCSSTSGGLTFCWAHRRETLRLLAVLAGPSSLKVPWY